MCTGKGQVPHSPKEKSRRQVMPGPPAAVGQSMAGTCPAPGRLRSTGGDTAGGHSGQGERTKRGGSLAQWVSSLSLSVSGAAHLDV